MNKIYLYIIIFCFALALNACGGDDDINNGNNKPDVEKPGESGEPEEPEELIGSIYLSSTAETSLFPTKAAEGFPNNGSIGVIAARYNNTEADYWNTYPDINNAAATATSVANGVYNFSWDEIKYWPFDNSQLVFMAYSPRTENTGNLYLSSDRTTLLMQLIENMQDVLYASNNSAAIPFNKDSRQVDLGQFRHALSQLTVVVVADESMAPNIQLSSLRVSTPKTIANLFLTLPDSILVGENAEQDFIHTLASGNIPFKDQEIRQTILLFPGTEDYTKITIDLYSTTDPTTTSKEYMVSYFQDDTNPNESIKLERGKNTILTIKVKSRGINSTDIELDGTLSNWNYQGDFGITIN